MAQIRATDIDIILIRNILGAASTDLGTICTYPNVNRWARYKPISYQKTEALTEAEIVGANFGLTMKTINLNTIQNPQQWDYAKPTGGLSSPYRLADFSKYNHEAAPFVVVRDTSWKVANVVFDDFVILPTFKWGTGVNEGQSDGSTSLYNIEIYPYELKYAGAPFAFTTYYIGLCFILPNNVYSWIWSDKQIGQATYASPLLLRFSSADSNLRNYMLNTMQGGDEIVATPVIASVASATAPYMFSVPQGNQIIVTKSAEVSFDWTMLELRLVSSRRGALGSLPSLAADPTSIAGNEIYKPYSADSGEVISVWIRVSAISVYTTAVLGAQVGMIFDAYTIGQGAVTMYNSYQGSQITSISLTPNVAREFWVLTQAVPASLFYNLPTYNGNQNTVVALQARLTYNAVVIPPSGYFTGKWLA